MDDIWEAARVGDLAEVKRLVGQDPGIFDAKLDGHGPTPLMWAIVGGHTGVVRWLVDRGAAIDVEDREGRTALWCACFYDRSPVARLLLERGADTTIADKSCWTPLMVASDRGHLEVVRLLLGNPSGKATINHRQRYGTTALWWACYMGRGGVVRALLESGANPTIANDKDITPVAIAKLEPEYDNVSAEGRRECVAALEVRLAFGSLSCSLSIPGHLLF
jgi:ankyrin repeat protein